MHKCVKVMSSTAAYSLLTLTILGCSSNRPNNVASYGSTTTTANMQTPPSIEAMIAERSQNSDSVNDEFQDLKAQLAEQQQQLAIMSSEQKILQEQLKRQSITLTIIPTAHANAGRTGQGTASIAYVAFLEEDKQFTETEERALKEITIIPNRENSSTLSIPQEARFIAIKVGLRYTKKRSQLLIPIESIDFEMPLTISIGACDINIKSGVNPESSPSFVAKLKEYQQPLVNCL